MRTFGLPAVGCLPPSTHILHFYHHGKELLELLALFCWAGLEEGECCLWVTAPPWTATLALAELISQHPEASAYVESGQMQFVAYEDWHVGDGQGRKHPEELLENASIKISAAHQHGWSRVRVCGNALQPLSAPAWATRLRYEDTLHQMILRSDLLVLCSYRRQGMAELVRSGLLHSHHAILTKDQERWHYAPATDQ